MTASRHDPTGSVSRREFLKTSAVASAAVLAGAAAGRVHAAGSDRIRFGLIGCGGRGTGAAFDCLRAADGVELVALGDLFEDRLEGAYRSFARAAGKKNKDGKSPLAEKIKLEKDRCFVGFDAYKKVIAADVDLVLLATPPAFRPAHLEAAVQAGKHVFMEKPVATDPAGVRSIIASGERARAGKLSIVAGTQRRHERSYVETIRRIHAGAIGELVGGSCYWNTGGLWVRRRRKGMTDMEWQVRNWYYFTWASGDHIVEQHVHNIDVVNWAFNAHPVKALGLGGRQVRTGKEYGNIFDHFAVEFEYPNGARVLSLCRQTPGASHRVGEVVVGTKGRARPGRGIYGQKPWTYAGPHPNPYVQEHADLIASIRKGQPINEARQVAESTMTAILGRMSAYTGREVSWKWAMNASKLDLVPKELEFGDLLVRPVAVPGKTPLI